MGQAKLRGTLEERVEKAKIRNIHIEKTLDRSKLPRKLKWLPTQRIATMLVAVGAVKH